MVTCSGAVLLLDSGLLVGSVVGTGAVSVLKDLRRSLATRFSSFFAAFSSTSRAFFASLSSPIYKVRRDKFG